MLVLRLATVSRSPLCSSFFSFVQLHNQEHFPMKKLFILVFFCFSLSSNAQILEGQVGIGSGFMNMVERFQGSPVRFSYPFSYSFGLSLAENDSSIALVALYNQVEYRLQRASVPNRVLKMNSFQLGVEQINRAQQTALGYRFTTGVGSEGDNPYSENSPFICISAAFLISQQLGDQLRFEAQPGLFWADVANSLRGSNYWDTAGEDVSLIVNVGLRYRFYRK
jgi:hypothetical protein